MDKGLRHLCFLVWDAQDDTGLLARLLGLKALLSTQFEKFLAQVGAVQLQSAAFTNSCLDLRKMFAEGQFI